MTEEGNWRKFDEKTLNELTYGAYQLKDSSGKVVYIGSGEVVQRLWAHFGERPEDKKEDVESFKIICCADKQEASEVERKLISEFKQEFGALPKYNKQA